ncbi:MAG: hypothetical protein ACJA0X_001146, partial [Cyclobacteriaceae bacterium]
TLFPSAEMPVISTFSITLLDLISCKTTHLTCRLVRLMDLKTVIIV